MTAVADSDHYTRSFYEAQRSGSRSSAKAMLTHVFNLFGRAPPTVVDVGCGVGTWLRVALDLGATRVQGFDGAWVQKADLEIPANCFTFCNLATVLPGALGSSERYDLVLSLEVAEHLPADLGPSFVATLCGLGDVVLFSAAIPHQGGVNHINETWPGYWNALFREQGFECFDAIRPVLWNQPDVEWWYAQNALIFARGQSWLREKLAPVAEPMPCVHPHNYLLQVAQTRELAAALSEATASPLFAPAPADAAGIERLERTILEAGSDAQNGLGAATLEALALCDRERNKVYALSTEVTRLKGETADLRARLNALEVELGRRSREADEARRALQEIAASTIWRVTAPLRAVVETGKRLAGLG